MRYGRDPTNLLRNGGVIGMNEVIVVFNAARPA